MTIEEEQARFLRCIGESNRLQIIKLLANGEKCVGEITEVLNKEQSLVSHHLRALKECNIVIARQEGQKIYYVLTEPKLAQLVFISESLMKELSICQSEGVCYEGQENQGCCETQILTDS